MFTAYFDRGEDAKSTVLSVGGYVATTQQWEAFERDWKQFLADEKISMFHMTEYECRHGEFKDWNNDRRRAAIQRAHALIKIRTNCGISTAVILPDYASVLAECPDVKDKMPSPFALCVNGCLLEVSNWIVKFNRQGQRVAYVLESGDSGMGEIIKVFDDITKDERLKSGCGFESIAVENKRVVLPLQAADINAYESWKHVANQVVAIEPSRPVRKSMWSLAGHTNFSRYFNREVLLELVDKIRAKSGASA
jgi:hypothetical protein